MRKATMSENRQTSVGRIAMFELQPGDTPMATLRKEIPVTQKPATVWRAVRDFGQVHTKVAPGFLTDLKMDKGDRIVTFFNGLVARERLVTLDDQACRLV